MAKDGPLPRSLRDVSRVYHYLLSPLSPLFSPSGEGSKASATPISSSSPPSSFALHTDGEFQVFKASVLAAETAILIAASFHTSTALPHPLAITYLQAVCMVPSTSLASVKQQEEGEDEDEDEDDAEERKRVLVSRQTVALLNAALLSPQMLYLTHQPHELAAAAVWLACRHVAAKMPEVAWWELFDIDREALGFLAASMQSVGAIMTARRRQFPDLLASGGPGLSREAVQKELARLAEVDG